MYGIFPFFVLADNHHNISIGKLFYDSSYKYNNEIQEMFFSDYLQSPKLYGMNVKYRYENDDKKVGFMTSFTYGEGEGQPIKDTILKNKDTQNSLVIDYLSTFKTKQYTVMLGPAYRYNDLVSVYFLSGINTSDTTPKYEESKIFKNVKKESYITLHEKRKSLSCAIGIQLNITKNLFLDLSYEKSFYNIRVQNTKNANSPKIVPHAINLGIGIRI